MVTELGYIEKCSDCPYYDILVGKEYCENLGQYIHYDDENRFDKFCPLKDEND